MMRMALEIKPDNTVRIRGLDYESRKLTLHYRFRDIIVVHVSGGSCWASLGERKYVPAQFDIWRIVEPSQVEDKKRTQFTVDRVVDFPIKKDAMGRKL